MQLKLDISNDSAGDEHECELCKRLLTDEECEIFDNLEVLEESVGSDVVTAILYIAEYLQKQAGQIRDNDTMYYYNKTSFSTVVNLLLCVIYPNM